MSFFVGVAIGYHLRRPPAPVLPLAADPISITCPECPDYSDNPLVHDMSALLAADQMTLADCYNKVTDLTDKLSDSRQNENKIQDEAHEWRERYMACPQPTCD